MGMYIHTLSKSKKWIDMYTRESDFIRKTKKGKLYPDSRTLKKGLCLTIRVQFISFSIHYMLISLLPVALNKIATDITLVAVKMVDKAAALA